MCPIRSGRRNNALAEKQHSLPALLMIAACPVPCFTCLFCSEVTPTPTPLSWAQTNTSSCPHAAKGRLLALISAGGNPRPPRHGLILTLLLALGETRTACGLSGQKRQPFHLSRSHRHPLSPPFCRSNPRGFSLPQRRPQEAAGRPSPAPGLLQRSHPSPSRYSV